ncbi:hypothetical protein D3C76_26170 [compost metagenome]
MPEHNPDEFGPLTPEQDEELQRHPLAHQDLFAMEADVKYYEDILKHTPETDPAYARMKAQLDSTQRFVHLKRRFVTYGTSTLITLNDVFDQRR